MRRFVEKLRNISQYECDEDVVIYGLEGIISALISIALLSMLSVLTNSVRDLLVFLPLHVVGVRFTGGYHAKTPVRCQLLTLVSFAMVYAFTNVFSLCVGECWILALSIISTLYICLASPVLNIRKPMTKDEIRVNRNKSRIFAIVIDCLVLISLVVISSKWMAASLLSNMLEISIFMFLGRRLYVYEKAKDRRVDAEDGGAFCK